MLDWLEDVDVPTDVVCEFPDDVDVVVAITFDVPTELDDPDCVDVVLLLDVTCELLVD